MYVVMSKYNHAGTKWSHCGVANNRNDAEIIRDYYKLMYSDGDYTIKIFKLAEVGQ